jgi:hypothetical protein
MHHEFDSESVPIVQSIVGVSVMSITTLQKKLAIIHFFERGFDD